MDAAFIFKVTLIGLLSGVVGTGGGGSIVYLLKRPGATLLSTVLGFSAGVMLVVVFMELLPESMAIGGYCGGIGGLILGIVILFLLDIYFPHHHHYSPDCRESQFRKSGMLLGIGIALHNIPEGLAIGAGYAASETLGLGLALIMTVQNIPEGMAMATTMCIGGFPNRRTVFWSALAGLPMAAGAFGGAVVGRVSPGFLSVALSFAAGAMLYITCDELVPGAKALSSGYAATLGIVGGVVAGLLLTLL